MTPGLRERKKLATRLRLHQVALELVARHGLDAVSVDDIAARAEVSPRTFFNYFATKEEAVIGLDPNSSHRLADAFLARPAAESPVQALRAALQDQAREMADETGVWPLRLQVIDTHPALVGRLTTGFGRSEGLLAAAIAARTGTDLDLDPYAALLAAVQAAVMRSSLHRWRVGDFTASLPDLVDEAWELVVAGMPAPVSPGVARVAGG